MQLHPHFFRSGDRRSRELPEWMDGHGRRYRTNSINNGSLRQLLTMKELKTITQVVKSFVQYFPIFSTFFPQMQNSFAISVDQLPDSFNCGFFRDETSSRIIWSTMALDLENVL